MEKCLELRQTPQRRVHALLGGGFSLQRNFFDGFYIENCFPFSFSKYLRSPWIAIGFNYDWRIAQIIFFMALLLAALVFYFLAHHKLLDKDDGRALEIF